MATDPQPMPQAAESFQAVDASSRVPISMLFAGAAFWIVVAFTFGLVASLKLHQPNLLADTAIWTYGRVIAASSSALVYGFALPSAVGVGLWLLFRLGQVRFQSSGLLALATGIWNLGVLSGVCAILGGGSTGFDLLEMPWFTVVPLLAAWVICGTSGVVALVRTQRPLYPTQWFIAGALFWFPWIYATASLLLMATPVRGVLQAAVSGWYSHNLEFVVLGFAGLGSIFYFTPKLLGRALHSAVLALVAFWTLAVFGSLGGINPSGPFPAWMASLSTVDTVLMTIPLLAVAINLVQTVRHDLNGLDKEITLRCTYAASVFFLVAGAHHVVSAIPSVGSLVAFTTFTTAQRQLWINGFFALASFGAIYYVLPRALDRNWPFPKLISMHFWFYLLGLLVSYIALLVGGVAQGYLLSDPKISFAIAMKTTLPALRLDAVGWLLLLLAQLAFVINVFVLLIQHVRQRWLGLKQDLTTREVTE